MMCHLFISGSYSPFMLSYFFLSFLQQGESRVWVNSSLTDLRKCKVSQDGVEYKGDIHKTVGSSLCQNWNTENPIHEVSENLTDADFVDGKKYLAKNYCRNPKQKYSEPWCYTLDQDLLDDVCQVPLCSFSDCRLTGPGVEYGGNISKTVSGQTCIVWSEKIFKNYEAFVANKSDQSSSFWDIFKSPKKNLPDSSFSDGSRSKAENFCRNPTGDVGGPWCLTKHEDPSSDEVTYEKHYCSVPFCDEPDCLMFTTESLNESTHTHWTEIPEPERHSGKFVFKTQLWSPAAWRSGELRIALSYLPLPMNGSFLRTHNVGLEIVISNSRIGITPSVDEEPEWESLADLLSGAHKTSLTLNWMKGSITLNENKQEKPLFLRLYEDVNSIMGLTDGPFKFFSVLGSAAFWSFPFCTNYCQQHITTSLEFPQILGLRKFGASRMLSFHVRAKGSVCLEFYTAPSIKYPNIRLELLNSQFKTIISVQETADQDRRTLSFKKSSYEVTYWEWREFSVNVIGKRFVVYSTEESSSIKLLEASDPVITSLAWFSIGTDEVVGHWTLFCSPLELPPIPEAEPPECVMNQIGENYHGTQWINAFGKPCLVWIYNRVAPLVNEAAFPEASLISSLNFCRNPTNDPKGPYCYLLDVDGDPTISYCQPRQCRVIDCRRSGSGLDYMGSLNITYGNYTCIGQKSKKQKAGDNVCQNKNNDPGGPWCFVTDPGVYLDRCNVPDCSKAERSTLIVSDSNDSTKEQFFVAPHWKSDGVQFWLKSWIPKLTTGLSISIFNWSSNGFYNFTIGAEKNRKLVLSFHDGEGKEELLQEKVIPYLIKSGKWSGFWMKLPMGRLEFGLEGVVEPLFDFNLHPPGNKTFMPTRVHYGTVSNRYIGIHFRHTECLTGVTEASLSKVLFPVNVWMNGDFEAVNNRLLLHIRGSGVTIIQFFRVPSKQYGLIMKIDGPKFEIISNLTKASLFLYSVPLGFSVNPAAWSSLEIRMIHNVLEVTTNDKKLFQWTSPFPLIYYFFSVANENGRTIWIANCEAPGIDGEARNGGWGEWGGWDCSVSCGGGQGIRYRKCDRPPPNLFGLGCQGPSYAYGICNTHKCGTLSEDTLDIIRNTLRRKAHSINVTVGDPIQLDCIPELVTLIRIESPESELEWTFNGQTIDKAKHKLKNLISDESASLVIGKAILSNTGVFVCVFNSIDGMKQVIQITAVTVWTKEFTRSVRKTRPLKLICHSIVLSYIFADLQEQWTLNDSLIKNSTVSALTAFETDQMDSINYNHSGEWTCIVSQDDLGLYWKTAWMRVKVLEKPTFWTYLIEEDVTRVLFSFMSKGVAKIALFLFYVFVAAGVVCFANYYNTWVKEYQGDTS